MDLRIGGKEKEFAFYRESTVKQDCTIKFMEHVPMVRTYPYTRARAYINEYR